METKGKSPKPSREARYAEKWWKRNGYRFQRLDLPGEETYKVWLEGGIVVKWEIRPGCGKNSEQMKAFQKKYEIKTSLMKIPTSGYNEKDSWKQYVEEVDV